MKIKLIFILTALSFSCGRFTESNSNTFRVRFDNVDRLTNGDIVTLNKKKIGTVKNLELDSDNRTIATIQLDGPIDIPRGSEFILTYAFLARPEIMIEPTSDTENIDMKLIQVGKEKRFQLDTLSAELSKSKYDSLMKFDSVFRIKDSIVKTLLPPIKEN